MLTRVATTADLPQLHTFLHRLGLPVAGLDEHLAHSVVVDGEGGPHALAALEVHGSVGLLRSVAVAPERRGQGLAQHLVQGVIERASALGLTDLYLLTTTAAAYFPRFGFQPVPRDVAPAMLHASREVQGVCPASATLMHLALLPRSVAMTQTLPQTIPGLTEPTTTAALTSALRVLPQRPLEFHLHGHVLVPAGYHVTEVKAVTIEAMDCGGNAAAWRETVIQLMDGSTADAQGGFMTNRKFLAIYDRVVKHIPVRDEAEVRFEYGNASTPAMQYHVTHVDAQPERVIIHLRTPGVQCKAGDACGPSGEGVNDECAPALGCCGPQQPMTLS
ncbi:arsenic resistance N-acetyltransferase ArsN2 [Deinococcus aquaedulcis]|uniref:arsenic resistance N-acetyltransferase ArsN2 n=1 Tax=Deinococcus aquaedulcis TaxID=2840455 RepID=UPI002E2877F9|nr:arsenic resistance N-acetyltransferase ArsN2 [Deinococcus aquaedulcis]